MLGKAIEFVGGNNEEKRQVLKRKAEQLESMEADVIIEIENAELSGKKRKNEVAKWLSNVGKMKNEVQSIEQEVEQGGWSISLRKRVEKKTEEVNELIDQRNRFCQGGLVLDVPNNNGDPMLAPVLVGQEFQKNKDKIVECLMEEEVISIGIYGMGGVGKTTLVMHIHNELLHRGINVCWITVSKDFSIYKLQDRITKAISFDISKEEDVKKRAAKLSSVLERGKFVLILDDLWNHFTLNEMGIPIKVDGCKLILTSRSLDVCWRMSCQKNFKVEPLSREQSWKLFTEKIGGAVPAEVEPFAKSIVRECDGLPLGIIALVGSMRGVTDVHEWRNALTDLKESKIGETDMEYEVFRVLKFSYNRLTNLLLQRCLLYCAFYPEDHEIIRKDLIEYLIAEEVIEGGSRQANFDKGYTLLSRLERVCLLETGQYKECVKMHDLIRDMAIQIMKINPRAMVEADKQLREMPDVEKWTEDLVRCSLMDNDIMEIPCGYSPRCPNLSTLLLCNNLIRRVAASFFEQLNGLMVLDLSSTYIAELPSSISYLVNLSALLLRRCRRLRHVPSLAQIKALKKLDLNNTSVEEVPQGIELQSNLRYLDLEGTKIKEFPPGILPKLSNLQYLHLGWSFTVKGEELALLGKLEDLRCRFYDVIEFNTYNASTQSSGLINYRLAVGVYTLLIYVLELPDQPPDQIVSFVECNINEKEDVLLLPKDVGELSFTRCHISLCLKKATKPVVLTIRYCDEIECLLSSTSSPTHVTFSIVKSLEIIGCPSMKKLFPCGSLSNLQNLEKIVVEECENMEELVEEEEEIRDSNGSNQFTLPKLQTFELRDLPQLKSICNGKLICNTLEKVVILDCPKLKQMPLSLIWRDNVGRIFHPPHLKTIQIYPTEWWWSCELDTDHKHLLSSFIDFSEE